MAAKGYFKTSLTGGGTTALDGIDGSALASGDMAVILQSTDFCSIYRLNATSGAAESSPDIISPDTNAGDKRWILEKILAAQITTPTIAAKTSAGLALQDDGANVGLTVLDGGQVKLGQTIATYANNAAALAGGLVAGQLYRTNADPSVLCVVLAA